MTFNTGDRVYYRDNGPTDLGTVTKVGQIETARGIKPSYTVEWDNGVDNGEYFSEQLVKA